MALAEKFDRRVGIKLDIERSHQFGSIDQLGNPGLGMIQRSGIDRHLGFWANPTGRIEIDRRLLECGGEAVAIEVWIDSNYHFCAAGIVDPLIGRGSLDRRPGKQGEREAKDPDRQNSREGRGPNQTKPKAPLGNKGHDRQEEQQAIGDRRPAGRVH